MHMAREYDGKLLSLESEWRLLHGPRCNQFMVSKYSLSFLEDTTLYSHNLPHNLKSLTHISHHVLGWHSHRHDSFHRFSFRSWTKGSSRVNKRIPNQDEILRELPSQPPLPPLSALLSCLKLDHSLYGWWMTLDAELRVSTMNVSQSWYLVPSGEGVPASRRLPIDSTPSLFVSRLASSHPGYHSSHWQFQPKDRFPPFRGFRFYWIHQVVLCGFGSGPSRLSPHGDGSICLISWSLEWMNGHDENSILTGLSFIQYQCRTHGETVTV